MLEAYRSGSRASGGSSTATKPERTERNPSNPSQGVNTDPILLTTPSFPRDSPPLLYLVPTEEHNKDQR